MNKLTLLSLLILVAFSLNGCSTFEAKLGLNKRYDFKSYVSFNKPHDSFGGIKKDKIPFAIGLILPIGVLNADNKARATWTWVFVEGLKPIFEEVIIINDLGTIERPSQTPLTIRPEVWTIGLCFPETGCIYGFKFRFYDKYGIEKFSIIAEGRTTVSKDANCIDVCAFNKTIAWAEAIDDLMRKFQYSVIQRKDELLTISQK